MQSFQVSSHPMIYCNGKITRSSEAVIDPQDRGLLLGDGLFETIRCEQGNPIALADHWARLQTGLDYLGIVTELNTIRTQQIICDLLKRNELDSGAACARITITRGAGPRGLLPRSHAKSTALITVAAVANTNPEPINATLSSYIINDQSPLSRFKTLNYLDKISARREADSREKDEAILLNTRGFIASASCANIFIVHQGVLFTPSLDCGALPGIMRKKVIASAMRLEIKTLAEEISTESLYRADEVFVTNSLIKILPVKNVDAIEFNQGEPGPITHQLMEQLNLDLSLC